MNNLKTFFNKISAQMCIIPTWNITKDIPLIPLIPGEIPTKINFLKNLSQIAF